MYWNTTEYSGDADTNRLTLTWDVLKLICKSSVVFINWRLTLTWDVLKSEISQPVRQILKD